MTTLVLKVDVCTHDGMRDGVPRLLRLFAQHDVHASFFLAFGPDNSGRAVANVFRPGFLRKMVRSGAPSLYGVRTMLSGTLLPARPIASRFPEVVRRIHDEGHEVALHGWDHRRWQDGVLRMEGAEIAEQYGRAISSYRAILGRAPSAWGSPAWIVTPRSLAFAESFGFRYASDLRGGPPCRLIAEGRELRTPQVPTTGRCVEELLACGVRGDEALRDALVLDLGAADPAVLAVHAEVEGGPFLALLDGLLSRLLAEGVRVLRLDEFIAASRPASFPLRALAYASLPGRSGRVATSVELP